MRRLHDKPGIALGLFALWVVLISFPLPVAGAERLVILPFENRSQQAEYNWVRDSFMLTLTEVISPRELAVVQMSERDLVFERLRLNPQDLLTRASMVRVAETAQANLALIGEFDIGGEGESVTIAVAARLIETSAGRLVANKTFNFSGPLADLRQIQAQLAWRVAYQRDPSMTETKEQFVERLSIVPPSAFESYVKAIQTTDQKRREFYLRRAIREYGGDGASSYGAALYELGLLAYRGGDDAEAAKLFGRIDSRDARYESGLFHLGLAAFRLAEYRPMVEALQTLSRGRQTFEVLNNLAVGYVAIGEVEQAVPLLQRLVASRPPEMISRFNFGYALWRSGRHEEAISHLRAVLELAPQDGEALFLLARSLRETGREAEAASFDNQAKRYLPGYAKWAVDAAAIPMLGRISHDYDPSASVMETVTEGAGGQAGRIRQRLDGIRRQLEANDEAGAWQELEALDRLGTESGEVAYLRGLIHQRRGEGEAAFAQLRAAVARDPRLFEAHLLLARIYFGRNDRAQATAHVNQALAIDPANREAAALKQRIEVGR